MVLSQTHLDTEEQSHKKDGNGEEEEEHKEPGTPVEPVAETHHPHVLLKCKRKLKVQGYAYVFNIQPIWRYTNTP